MSSSLQSSRVERIALVFIISGHNRSPGHIQEGKVLGRLGSGKAFGELAILYNCKRTASVKVWRTRCIWKTKSEQKHDISIDKDNILLLGSVSWGKGGENLFLQSQPIICYCSVGGGGGGEDDQGRGWTILSKRLPNQIMTLSQTLYVFVTTHRLCFLRVTGWRRL